MAIIWDSKRELSDFSGGGRRKKQIKDKEMRQLIHCRTGKINISEKEKSILGWKGKYNLCCHKRVQ